MAPAGRGFLRRWGPWLLLVAVVVAAGVVGAQGRAHPTLDQRAVSLGNRVRCPVCEGQDVNQSDTPPSLAIKADIRSQLAAGRSDDQILSGIVDSYGSGILERPPASGFNLLVWLLPILAVAAAAIGLGFAFRAWRPARSAGSYARSASAADQRLVDDALASDDGEEGS